MLGSDHCPPHPTQGNSGLSSDPSVLRGRGIAVASQTSWRFKALTVVREWEPDINSRTGRVMGQATARGVIKRKAFPGRQLSLSTTSCPEGKITPAESGNRFESGHHLNVLQRHKRQVNILISLYPDYRKEDQGNPGPQLAWYMLPMCIP